MATLLIISHTEHYLVDGVYHGWGATVREIDHLATMFDNVVHLAPLHDAGGMNRNALAYTASSVTVMPVRPSGGNSFVAKLGIIAAIPAYVRAIREAMRHADVIHVRCPANISLTALLVLLVAGKGKKIWIKYAGNWRPRSPFPLSYSLQRMMLRGMFRHAIVTVNGTGSGDPRHVISMLNPSLTDDEVVAASEGARYKELCSPYRLLTVGRTETEKGTGNALEILKRLKESPGSIHLDVVGDGPQRHFYEEYARKLGVAECVSFHGWVGRNELNRFYERSHVFLLLSKTEGWPKVVGEAMAFGCVPVCSDVSSIGHHLARFGTGAVVDREDITKSACVVRQLLSDPVQWKRQSSNAARSAMNFSYRGYTTRLREILNVKNSSLPVQTKRGCEVPDREGLHAN
ncbi:MAG: glycosyltransferase [Bacteroidetes bacterium]|nr:glycosyltransferase [Bacteroidota bacterium]MCW5897457.1 glycosyltransferase [Bacteroidota bacterium]